jgi:hypothetical protein
MVNSIDDRFQLLDIGREAINMVAVFIDKEQCGCSVGGGAVSW